MLGLLGAISAGQGADALGPSVGLDGLAELTDQVRAAGVSVTLDVTELPDLAAGLDATCFRIVQEALTNVVKHASGAAATVSVQCTDDLLTVMVEDTGGSGGLTELPGTGRGLIGMRQRAELYGGHVDAGPRGDGFVVVATFRVEHESARPRRLLRGRRRSS